MTKKSKLPAAFRKKFCLPVDTRYVVREEICHGDFWQERYEYVDLDDIESVIGLLNSCCYLRLPDPDFGEGAVLVSRTYKEIVASRRADAKRVIRELKSKGESNVGWVTYYETRSAKEKRAAAKK